MRGAWLCLDTAAPRACVAVVEDGRPRATRALTETRRHAEELASAIEGALADAAVRMGDLEGVAVGAGPGSFVGLRVGIAHAKGLCAALRIPLVGLCSLTPLAAEPGLPDGRGLAVLDARRGELYVREVERRGASVTATSEPAAMSPEAATERARGLSFVVGNAVELLGAGPAARVPLEGPSGAGLALALAAQLGAEGAKDERETLVPRYCRAPDAKLPSPR